MNHLTRSDYATAFQLLARVETQAKEIEGFALAAATVLDEFVGPDVATLCVCDLLTGHRKVVSTPGRRPCRDAEAVRSFDGGPLDHAVAVPLYEDAHTLVHIVLNRHETGFDERHRARLELLLPHLAFLCAHACQAAGVSTGREPQRTPAAHAGLTTREREVLQWLARGKTDADIASLLAISPRTVNKHLEHIYVKLGVETRTAAVMRALTARLVDGGFSLADAPDGSAHEAPASWPPVQPAGVQASRHRSNLRSKPA